MDKKKRSIEWSKIFEILLIFLLIPTIIFYIIGLRWPAFLNYAYYFLVWLFISQAGLSYMYSITAFGRSKFRELSTAKHIPLPKSTFIVSAYLPNELEVIEDTLLNILERIQRPEAGIELILAYNTPHMEGIEPRLRELAYKWPELILANAYGSRSKSENLNYALEIASGEMIVLLDADHLVAADCLKLAWRWLDEGYNVVQGRCKIRNGKRSLVSALVEVEFEAIYGISHYAKSKLFDSTLFGGTNGYWRSSVIKKIKFDPGRLTEDIDATLRAILQGNHIVHDRTIISTELAPETMAGLWFQRKRWSQGWFQCSLKYQMSILRCKFLNILQKFMWTTLLMWRVVYDILSHLLFPVVFAFWLTRGKIEFPMNNFIWFALFFVMLSGPFEALVAYKNASSPRAPVWQYIYYAFFAFWYTLFKNTIQVVAIRDELLGKREWVVSQRKK
ncbi:MAG: glycosyltransferase [Candidatus Omnitrophota bacterium]